MANDGNKLPPSLERDNFLSGVCHPFINPLSAFAVIQYSVNCYRAAKRKTLTIPVVKLDIINTMNGESCALIESRLWKYGVSTQIWMCGPWMMDGEYPVLNHSFLVPKTQAWMADVVLRWFEGNGYKVTSQPVFSKRGGWSHEYAATHAPWKPWGVEAKPRSFQMWIGTLLFGWLKDRKKISAQIQKEIEQMREERRPSKRPAQKQTKKPNKRKQKQNKFVEFLKS